MRQRGRRVSALLALVVFVVAGAATAEEGSDSSAWRLEWKNGFHLSSPDGAAVLGWGGRLQGDWAFFSAPAAVEARTGRLDGGTELRRARLYFTGRFHGRLEVKVEYDFAGGEALPQDFFVGFLGLPVLGTVRVGHVKEPIGLDYLTSANYSTFLERPLPIQAYGPGRNTGIEALRGGRRWSWAAGLFRQTDSRGSTAGSEAWSATARLTTLFVDRGRRLVHLGLAASDRHPQGEDVDFSSDPELQLAPAFVDTGPLAARTVRLLGLESAWVDGPFSLQGELFRTTVARPRGDRELGGGYLAASWVLTGESRPYQRAGGVFGRLLPRRPWGSGPGAPGAWEIALRASSLDLDAGEIQGGRLRDLTVAVNWYPASNARVMLDLVRADLRRSGVARGLGLRLHVEF